MQNIDLDNFSSRVIQDTRIAPNELQIIYNFSDKESITLVHSKEEWKELVEAVKDYLMEQEADDFLNDFEKDYKLEDFERLYD